MVIRFMLAMLALMAIDRPAEAQSRYTVTDLGVLPGKQSSDAYAVNSLGEVVGASYAAVTGWSPFRWTSGMGIQPLALPPSIATGEAYGINDSGQICGFIGSTTGNHAVRWDADGSVVILDDRHSAASSINARGDVVGKFLVPVVPPPFPGGPTHIYYAVRWDPLTGADALPSQGEAESINDAGEVVGQSVFGGRARATLWDIQGVRTNLGALAASDFSSVAYGNNNEGQVVGKSGNRAFLWSEDQGMRALGALPGAQSSWAGAINDLGSAVGHTYISPSTTIYPRATLWDANGPHDLNQLLDASGAGWSLIDAKAISNGGHIVGTGFNPQGAVRAFLLTPQFVPEPVSPWSLLVGAPVILLARRPKAGRIAAGCSPSGAAV